MSPTPGDARATLKTAIGHVLSGHGGEIIEAGEDMYRMADEIIDELLLERHVRWAVDMLLEVADRGR